MLATALLLLDEYPLLTVSTETPSHPLCVTVVPYSSSSTGAPPERIFEYLCFFLCLPVVCWFKRMGSITPQEGLVYRRFSRFEEARFDRSWTTCPTSTKYRYKR